MIIRRILPVLLSLAVQGQVITVAQAADGGDVNFKIYSPPAQPVGNQPSASAGPSSDSQPASEPGSASEVSSGPAITDPDPSQALSDQQPAQAPAADSSSAGTAQSAGTAADGQKIASKVLQGYIRVVPSGTKIPIIMDTAIDTETSQEGDEFSARTAEDLTIDGSTAVPAGSIIKGRIAQLNAPRHLNRSGSVALKFDTVTTPDNRQIPIIANLVARGGVVHARRGLKDIAMDTGIVTLPAAAGLGIGLLAGNAGSSSLGAGGGALIGAGVGAAVGVAILLSKKGKKVDVRPGDELKIELAEDLRMPM